MSRFSKVNGSWVSPQLSTKSMGKYTPSLKESLKTQQTWKTVHESVNTNLAEFTLENVTASNKTTFCTISNFAGTVIGTVVVDGVVTQNLSWVGPAASRDVSITVPANKKAKVILNMLGSGSLSPSNTNYSLIQFSTNDLVKSIDHLHMTNYKLICYPMMQSTRLVSVPNEVPPSVTVLSATFLGSTSLNCPFDKWDTKNITMMTQVFQNTTAFNQPLGTWNVSKVTNMFQMFMDARGFNQNLTAWNVTKVTSWTNFRTGSALAIGNTPIKFR